jgi:hypothetical protein
MEEALGQGNSAEYERFRKEASEARIQMNLKLLRELRGDK